MQVISDLQLKKIVHDYSEQKCSFTNMFKIFMRIYNFYEYASIPYNKNKFTTNKIILGITLSGQSECNLMTIEQGMNSAFYLIAFEGLTGIVFIHGVQLGGQLMGKFCPGRTSQTLRYENFILG